jgi:DnaK suppressor protein
MHRLAVMTTATNVRDRLRARRTQLLARYRDAGDRADEELATPARDPVDAASEQWDARVLSEMSDADARSLDSVIDALDRLDAGTYGICAACRQPIEPARLRLLPEAAECADCARFAEDTPPRSVTSAGAER